MTRHPDPSPGDEVIVVRCDTTPLLAGELAVIVAGPDQDGIYRVRNGGDVEGFCARADFVVRKNEQKRNRNRTQE